MDETITVARSWAPAFAEVLRARADLLAQQPAEVRPFLEELARFDGVFSKESRGALYHTALRRVLSEKHLDQMGALSDAIESSEQLTPTQQQQLVQAAVEARESLLAAYGRVELAYGDVHKVGRGGVSLPIGGAVVAGAVTRKNTPGPAQTALAIPSVTRVASVRALGFVTDPATKTERLIGGERVPFVVHFATQGVQSYAQTLWGVSDVPSSPHYSDQADLASRKALRPIPLSVAALERDGATETVLTIRAD
jgi:acyl-homoserine lactone acylase PvdQ